MDVETGQAKGNYYIPAGERMAVTEVGASPSYRTRREIEVVGARYLGLAIDYVPIEESVKG